MNDFITAELKRSSDVISRIDPVQIRKAADVIKESVKNGGQIIFMGNGGSSADAQHIAAEFSGKYAFDRPAMAGVCLSNIAPVTAIGNDYSYDLVFKRQIEAFCRKGDIVVGFSTSGNSKNVVLALQAAKSIGAYTISFTGDCGVLREQTDLPVIIPTTETPRVQEGYLVACHTICGIVEREIFGKKAVLVDRDDTLAIDAPYCGDPDKVVLFPGVPEAISKLNKAGYLVIVVTNQSGIGRGLIDEAALAKVHERLVKEVEAGGGKIDDIYYCPHHPDVKCGCRKPEIGMGVAAIVKHNINPSKSFMIGDMDRDIEFGKKLGLESFKVSGNRTFAKIVDEILSK
jgi:D-sedoheptulose 7-phosphate isomerase